VPKLYAYNGAVLPELPGDGYSVIVQDVENDQYGLVQSNEPFCTKNSSGTKGICHNITAEVTGYLWKQGMRSGWVSATITTEGGNSDWAYFSATKYPFHWCSHDILDDDGTVSHKATEPVRVADTPVVSIAWQGREGDTLNIPSNWPTPGIKVTASVIDGGTLEAKWYRDGKLVLRKGIGDRFYPSTKIQGSFQLHCVVVNSVDGITARAQSNSLTIKVTGAAVDLLDMVTGMALGLAFPPLPYSKPSRVPVAFLYNGVRLPGLPGGYPYALLEFSTNAQTYYVWLFENPVHVNNIGLLLPNNGAGAEFRYTESGDSGEWELVEEWGTPDSAYDSPFGFPQGVIWANYDVLEKDGTTVRMAASEPVPVYE